MKKLLYFLIILMITFACKGNSNKNQGDALMQDFKISSPAFNHKEFIPVKFTCDGPNVSPELLWSGAPAGTKSFALICDDPDAPVGTWVHWVIYNIPSDVNRLEEGIPREEKLENGITQGKNDFGYIGYGGPCPPKGNPHRYFFKLYALNMATQFEPGLTKDELLKKIEGHVIQKTEFYGKYQR